jgi:hypothetical protein
MLNTFHKRVGFANLRNSAMSLHHLTRIQQTNPLGIGAVGRVPWHKLILRSEKNGVRNCILHALGILGILGILHALHKLIQADRAELM